ncbi:GNAT family N-acetyltransferase [Actinomadura harenae]|uniref:GNAT family N-acetyltransferase n=1 Tax=Actinomadura harenae TaxID=2483351 RepID=A0A3M2MB21_9ACTN|nr:GNAT family N-acetyltransferase [Actinomadura harenae]RMI46984.1 GNAT family N-acetyltransferase [Actinomadura harenae]
MNSAALTLRPARDEDVPDIIRLIDDAALWLRGQGTSQWARPWPNEAERRRRIERGIELSKETDEDGPKAVTWLVIDDEGRPVATTYITRVPDRLLWTDEELKVKTVYLHRLVIDRDHAGAQLGERLIQWVGEWGRVNWGAEVIRIDVWADNVRLHEYYLKRDFAYMDEVLLQADGTERPDPRLPMHVYPSGVVLHRPLKAVEHWPWVLGLRPDVGLVLGIPGG